MTQAYSAFEKGFQRGVHEALGCLQRLQDVRLRNATGLNVRTSSKVAELVNKPCLCGNFLNGGVQSDFSCFLSRWLWLRLSLGFPRCFPLRGALLLWRSLRLLLGGRLRLGTLGIPFRRQYLTISDNAREFEDVRRCLRQAGIRS